MISFTLVGCGFLGSLFAEEVARRATALNLPLGMRLYDADGVEARNIVNQLFSWPHINSFKSQALAAILSAGYPCIESAKPCVKRVKDSSRLAGKDTLVCAVDNIEARLAMWYIACRQNRPLLSLGVSQHMTGEVAWYIPGRLDQTSFSPANMARFSEEEKQKLSRVEQAPPCELVDHRVVGMVLAHVAAKSLFVFAGLQHDEQKSSPVVGRATAWRVSLINGAVMLTEAKNA